MVKFLEGQSGRGTGLPLSDLVHLRSRVWLGRPDLRDAFLNGYGRDLTGLDTRTLQPLLPRHGNLR
jgi:hypothetical protein